MSKGIILIPKFQYYFKLINPPLFLLNYKKFYVYKNCASNLVFVRKLTKDKICSDFFPQGKVLRVYQSTQESSQKLPSGANFPYGNLLFFHFGPRELLAKDKGWVLENLKFILEDYRNLEIQAQHIFRTAKS